MMKILLLFLIFLGCSAVVAQPFGIARSAFAFNKFSFKLLAQSRQSLSRTNYFLSPAGLAFALSMLENGAQGETSNQIMATLQAEGISLDELNENNKLFTHSLAALNDSVKLDIANAIWINGNAPVKSRFISVNQKYYDAAVQSENFSDPQTVADINHWAAEKTNHKISKMFDPPLDPTLQLILLNAIYFKGAWEAKFDANQTHELPFTLAGGAVIQHPRMSHSAHYPYYEDDQCQMVELKYKGGDLSMVVVLPKQPLDGFLKSFDAAPFERALGKLKQGKGTVEIPKFKIENEYELSGVLQSMGMKLAFSPKADFRELSDNPLFVSFVKHKTYVDVNEEGTEAAAVTAVGVRAMIAMREHPFQFVVDRPFLMAIRDRKTGLILFLGAIFDPR